MGVIDCLLLFTVFISSAFALVSGIPSCHSPSTQEFLTLSPAVDIAQYISQFCDPGFQLSVTPKEPHIRNWTIDSRTLEIRAELNISQDACQDVSYHFSERDEKCQNSLSLLADRCEIQIAQTDFWAAVQVDECLIWTLESSGESKIARRALSTSFNNYVQKGSDYVEELEDLLQNPQARDKADLTDSQMQQAFKLSYPKLAFGSVSLGGSDYLKQKFRISATDEIYDVDAKYKMNDRLHYHNYHSPSGGFLVAADNLRQSLGANIRQSWAQVTWYVWEQTCKKETPPVSPSTLRGVARDRIVNGETANVLKEAFGAAGQDLDSMAKSGKTSTSKLVWTRSDRSYYAVIGTPNGRGVIGLLRDRPVTLGKTIQSITAYGKKFGSNDDPEWSWELVFILSRHEPDEDCGCSGMSCIVS